MRSGIVSYEPIDGLELALLVASESAKLPGKSHVCKEYYVSQLLKYHSTMADKVTVTGSNI